MLNVQERWLMKKIVLSILALGLSCFTANADDWKVGAITISEPFARASVGMAKSGGGFFQINNDGESDRLLSAHSDVGGMTELHTHIKDGDVMRMRQVKAIDVPAHASVSLKPGGYHVMFMKLKAPLKEGASFPLELTFEKSGKVTIEMPVAGIGAKEAPGK